MDLEIKWHQMISLQDGSRENLIYTIPDIPDWEGVPGVYMFCRMYDGVLTPLYIGRTVNIAKRMKEHLNTTKLMKGIENSSKGEKVFVVGEFIAKSGQTAQKALLIIERTLIEHALGEGYELLNKSGTKTPVHTISFNGFAAAKLFTGPDMYAKQKR